MTAGPHVTPPDFLDFLADEALCDGGTNAVFLQPDWLAAVRRYVAALPPNRAIPLLVTSHGVRWPFLVDNPVPEVITAAVGEVAGWPRIIDLTVRLQALYALVRLGSAVTRTASAVLASGRPPQRLLLAVSLASAREAAARDTLTALLRDPNARVRAVAAWGIGLLDGNDADASAPHWCAGCGIADHADAQICPWCGRPYQVLAGLPWRALGAPRCPVPLHQS
ncbi:MAG: hypothetical protein WAV90_18505 [Gordonia amarae]